MATVSIETESFFLIIIILNNTCSETFCYNIVNTLFQTLFDIFYNSDNLMVVGSTDDAYGSVQYMAMLTTRGRCDQHCVYTSILH